MARISGITIPVDKKVEFSLTYIYGIGPKKSLEIIDKANVNKETRVKDLTEAELNKIRDIISADYIVEGELQRVVTTNVKRLKDIGSYRGERHKKNLPSKGQRTRTNARTRRGRRVAVGGAQPKAASKT